MYFCKSDIDVSNHFHVNFLHNHDLISTSRAQSPNWFNRLASGDAKLTMICLLGFLVNVQINCSEI